MKAILFPFSVILALLVFWFAATWASIAKAEQTQPMPSNCGGFADVTSGLKTRWGEEIIGRGLMASGSVLTLFSDTAGDSFTVLVVFPDGKACLAASGTGWEAMPPPVPGTEG